MEGTQHAGMCQEFVFEYFPDNDSLLSSQLCVFVVSITRK